MDVRNRTKENFDWDTEDDLYSLIETDPGSHPELDYWFPGLLVEEDIPGPVAAVETKKLDPNDIAATASDNSGIKNTTGVYDDSNTPTPIFTIKPIYNMEPDHEHEYSLFNPSVLAVPYRY